MAAPLLGRAPAQCCDPVHNALQQITLKLAHHELAGFSISGLATYLQVFDLDLCFDMGECPLSAVPINHVALTHAHGDHARCLLRHHALRDMMGLPTAATYYMPELIADDFLALARADARFEGVSAFVAPHIVAMRGDRSLVPLTARRKLFLSAFAVTHRVPSLGYTVVERRHKLKAELATLSGPEIAGLKRQGKIVTEERDTPLLTFIGDCVGSALAEQDHIWDSPVLIIETTFIADGDERMARDKGHTHLRELGELLHARGDAFRCEHLVLKHFSMKHKRDEIDAAIVRLIPENWHARIALLL